MTVDSERGLWTLSRSRSGMPPPADVPDRTPLAEDWVS